MRYIMINIRKNIFETNSSSTHAICVAKENDYTIPANLYFTFDEFGWENRTYYLTEELASYLYTAICTILERDKSEEYKNYIYETLAKYGCECSFEEAKYGRYGCEKGYIDHGYELKEWLDALRHSEKKLLRFLFSPDSFIITGNDNTDTFDDTVEDTDFSKVEVWYKWN